MKIFLILLFLAALGITGFGILAHNRKESAEADDEGPVRKNTMEGIGIEEIVAAGFLYYKDEETTDIDIIFNEEGGIAEITEINNGRTEREFELNEEQCERLKELILQYGSKVEEKSEYYWPNTDEYPDMRRLFCFEVWSEEIIYKETGALCYPDGWEEFWQEMEDIICE